jgi:hypothetical protein
LTASAGSDASPALENVEATVVSAGTLEPGGIAAFAVAPLESAARVTEALVAPGVGTGTASVELKFDVPVPGLSVGPGGMGPPGELVPEPPPPPHAARIAMLKTAPPRSAEIRFMLLASGSGVRN